MFCEFSENYVLYNEFLCIRNFILFSLIIQIIIFVVREKRKSLCIGRGKQRVVQRQGKHRDVNDLFIVFVLVGCLLLGTLVFGCWENKIEK